MMEAFHELEPKRLSNVWHSLQHVCDEMLKANGSNEYGFTTCKQAKTRSWRQVGRASESSNVDSDISTWSSTWGQADKWPREHYINIKFTNKQFINIQSTHLYTREFKCIKKQNIKYTTQYCFNIKWERDIIGSLNALRSKYRKSTTLRIF